jgi:hypothetical protein
MDTVLLIITMAMAHATTVTESGMAAITEDMVTGTMDTVTTAAADGADN